MISYYYDHALPQSVTDPRDLKYNRVHRKSIAMHAGPQAATLRPQLVPRPAQPSLFITL